MSSVPPSSSPSDGQVSPAPPGPYAPPPAGYPPQRAYYVQYVKPHRGAMILTFGIVSWMCCLVFGIVAWVMGNSDLEEMDAGIMDPSGREITRVGRLLGMIHVFVSVGVMAIYALGLLVMALVSRSRF